MSIRKAVILAAGYGTRFLPATKAVPKEMLPIVDRPVIHYIVEEAVAAGITQIIMVTALNKRAVEDYFDRDPDLDRLLEAKGDTARLTEMRRISDMADIAYVRQKERLGNGHAVLMVRSLIGDEPFALFFPDDVIFHVNPAIGQLAAVHQQHNCSVVAVQEVPRSDVVKYGVIEPEEIGPRLYNVRRIIEKPSIEEAPSNLTTVGRFVLTPRIFDVLDATPAGRAGEIWLMDALDRLTKEEPVYAYRYEGERFDCGQPQGLLAASLYIAARRDEIRSELAPHARALLPD